MLIHLLDDERNVCTLLDTFNKRCHCCRFPIQTIL